MIEKLQTEYKQCLEEKAAIGFGCSLISLLLVDYIFGADATAFYYFLVYNQVPWSTNFESSQVEELGSNTIDSSAVSLHTLSTTLMMLTMQYCSKISCFKVHPV